MSKRTSLAKHYFWSILIIIMLTLLAVFISIFVFEYKKYYESSFAIKEKLIADKKEKLKASAENTYRIIRYMLDNHEDNIRRNVKERVDEAFFMALSIYSKYSKTHSEQEIKNKILSMLRDIRFNGGNGYYFIFNSSSVQIMNPMRSELDGKVLKNKNGDFDLLFNKNVKKSGKGFVRYKWYRPFGNNDLYEKISYISKFDLFDWYIAAGVYIEDSKLKLQNQIIDILGSLKFPENAYILVGKNNGISILGPFKGRDLKGFKDKNNKDIVVELIHAANAGGGFVEYLDPWQSDGNVPIISYAIGIPEWGWYMSMNMPISDVNSAVERHQKLFYKRLQNTAFLFIAIFLLISLSVGLIFRAISLKFLENINSFVDFFQDSAADSKKMDLSDINYKEFIGLAESVNVMIAEKNNIQSEAAELRLFLKNIIDYMPSLIVAVDENGCITKLNKRAEEECGLSDIEASGKLVTDLFPYLQKNMNGFYNALNNQEIVHITKNSYEKAGQNVYLDIVFYPLGRGKNNGVVIRIDDESEKMRLQEAIIKNEKMVSLGGLAAGMAHEINNPLGIIMQTVQNTLRRFDAENETNRMIAGDIGLDLNIVRDYMEKRRIDVYLTGIKDAGERAAKIVQNMLDFSRTSSKDPSLYDINILLDKAIELAKNDYDLRKNYDIRKVNFIKYYDEALPAILVNDTEIQQVVVNLIKNAAQAMTFCNKNEDRYDIIMRTGREQNMVVIEVEDSGPGMDDDTLKRVFDPFYTTKDVGEGTGLGLSISFFIITNKHNGSIEAISETGKGAKFTIKLPIVG